MNSLLIFTLFLVVIFCVLRISVMGQHTYEIQRWSFICLAVGAFWVLGCELSWQPWLLTSEKHLNRLFAELVLYVGIFLVCVDSLWGELLKNRKCQDRRRKHSHGI